MWQAIGTRRRAHPRRSNVALGVCSVELSGPHEPSPRPGSHIHCDPVSYFLVLNVWPDQTTEKGDVAVQTGEDEAVQSEPCSITGGQPLLYAALLGSRAETGEAVKRLLAKVNDDHGGLPQELVLLFHHNTEEGVSSEDLTRYCQDHAIRKTTTQRRDSGDEVSATTGVSVLKRRCHYLLAGSGLSTRFWGMGILAAAQMERADLGVGRHPPIPFGTRGMVVTSPPPRNAWTPRAEPCTIFGSVDDVPSAQWIYQKGWIKARTDLQPEGLPEDGLRWVRLQGERWNTSDAALESPAYVDGEAVTARTGAGTKASPVARTSVRCKACQQTRRGQRLTQPHSHRWGECLRAILSPPAASGTEPEAATHSRLDVSFQERPRSGAGPWSPEGLRDEGADHQPKAADEERAASATTLPSIGPGGDDCPHAALALAMASRVELSEDEDQLVDECSLEWVDVDEYGIGNKQISQPTLPTPLARDRSGTVGGRSADGEDEFVTPPQGCQRRHLSRYPRGLSRHAGQVPLPARCAMVRSAGADSGGNLDQEAPQPGTALEADETVAPTVIRQAVGKDLDAWILAASVEHDSFLEREAVVEATPADLEAYGKEPLPMSSAWSRTIDDVRKCRAHLAGHVSSRDSIPLHWTEPAEPGSIVAAAKLASLRGWEVSLHGGAGATVKAPQPESGLILVEPPPQWKDWGLVGRHVVWRLQKTLSDPQQQFDQGATDLHRLKVTVGEKQYGLRQSGADRQIWAINTREPTLLGVICHQGNDFLVMAPRGEVHSALVGALTSLWTFGIERILSPKTSFTFLGIDWSRRVTGDIVLSQERFVQELLTKLDMGRCSSLKAITLDKPPNVIDEPTTEMLTELQAKVRSFHWLATRTRPDLAYYVSLLASSVSTQALWSQELVRKVLRYLAGTSDARLTMSPQGGENDLKIYTDAGFAGPATKSQNGLVICWGGSIITWRSSRGALSALSTAEAELCSAALGWQVGEEVRYFLRTLSIFPSRLELLIDNKAALTTASLGATWRTRYYAVRAHRLLQESQAGKVVLTYCPTKLMVADTLTKLATSEVISVLLAAMESQLPTHTAACRTSVSPGPSNRGDIAGDGPIGRTIYQGMTLGHSSQALPTHAFDRSPEPSFSFAQHSPAQGATGAAHDREACGGPSSDPSSGEAGPSTLSSMPTPGKRGRSPQSGPPEVEEAGSALSSPPLQEAGVCLSGCPPTPHQGAGKGSMIREWIQPETQPAVLGRLHGTRAGGRGNRRHARQPEWAATGETSPTASPFSRPAAEQLLPSQEEASSPGERYGPREPVPHPGGSATNSSDQMAVQPGVIVLIPTLPGTVPPSAQSLQPPRLRRSRQILPETLLDTMVSSTAERAPDVPPSSMPNQSTQPGPEGEGPEDLALSTLEPSRPTVEEDQLPCQGRSVQARRRRWYTYQAPTHLPRQRSKAHRLSRAVRRLQKKRIQRTQPGTAASSAQNPPQMFNIAEDPESPENPDEGDTVDENSAQDHQDDGSSGLTFDSDAGYLPRSVAREYLWDGTTSD